MSTAVAFPPKGDVRAGAIARNVDREELERVQKEADVLGALNERIEKARQVGDLVGGFVDGSSGPGGRRVGEMAVAPTPTIGGGYYVSGGTRME